MIQKPACVHACLCAVPRANILNVVIAVQPHNLLELQEVRAWSELTEEACFCKCARLSLSSNIRADCVPLGVLFEGWHCYLEGKHVISFKIRSSRTF